MQLYGQPARWSCSIGLRYLYVYDHSAGREGGLLGYGAREPDIELYIPEACARGKCGGSRERDRASGEADGADKGCDEGGWESMLYM